MSEKEQIKNKLEEKESPASPKSKYGFDEHGEAYSIHNFPHPATPENRELRRRILRGYLASKGIHLAASSSNDKENTKN